MARRKNPGLVKACPTNCSGGYPDNQKPLNEYYEALIPADVMETVKNKSDLRRCTYCAAIYEDGYSGKRYLGYEKGREFHRVKGY